MATGIDWFIHEHGGPTVVPPGGSGRAWLCRDGALVLDGPLFRPPPLEERRRLDAMRTYCKTLADRAQQEADALADALNPYLSRSVPPWQYPPAADWFRPHLGDPPGDPAGRRPRTVRWCWPG